MMSTRLLNANSLVVVAVAFGSVAQAFGCARPGPTDTTRESARSDASVTFVILDGASSMGAGDAALDPAVRRAAENAVEPRRTGAEIPTTPLPRTAAQPSAAPVATPGAAQTMVPVIPKGGTAPVLVPAQQPLGVPLPAGNDAGNR